MQFRSGRLGWGKRQFRECWRRVGSRFTGLYVLAGLYVLTAFEDLLKLIINSSKTLELRKQFTCGIEVTLLSKLEDSILPPGSHRGFGKTHSLDLNSLICELGGGIHQLTSEFLSSSSSSSLSRGTCHLLSKTGL